MNAILLDIEGTTTPIDFVHHTLFPFAKAKIAEYVQKNFTEIKNEISQLKTEHQTDKIYARKFDTLSPESVADYLEFLIEVDRKSTPLKSLQGKIWQKGYESGKLESVIFEDVPRAFKRWKQQGKTIAIYSSGSIPAQKLIFKYSNFGDLSGFISNYFDTNIGGKKETESYVKIAAALAQPPKRPAFISDITAELDAAKLAGFNTFLSIREGNSPIENIENYKPIYDFNEL